jgi:outer membrane receptor protein involved in Fe transport
LKYRYKHIAKADLEIVYKGFSLGGSFRYNSFMKNIDLIFTQPIIESPAIGITGINESREKFKNGDLIIDLRAGYQMTKTARLGFIVNNLLNREYMSRPANMMPPRTFAMQLALKI